MIQSTLSYTKDALGFHADFTLLKIHFTTFAKKKKIKKISKCFVNQKKVSADNISGTHDGNQFANYFTVHLNFVCNGS